MELRNYQAATIRGLFDWWKVNGNEPTVCVLPTAAGKTIIFSALIKNLKQANPKKRILILSHTKELVGQARDKLIAYWEGAPVGVYSAGLNERDLTSEIISASRDSIARVLNKFPPFDLIIIDEAHLINNKNEGRYRLILEHFCTANPDVEIVGFTATPFRAGESGGYIYGNDRLFKGVAHEVKMIELLKAGFLCPITAKESAAAGVIDTSKVPMRGDDFAPGLLAKASEHEHLVKSAVDDWKTKAYDKGRRSNCFFAVSVDHAILIRDAVIDTGIECELITGDTSQNERDKILARFNAGELTALVNVATLTTGWDCPRLDCIVLLRPTKSLVLYLQIIGRGLRLFEGKTDTLILDYGGNLERFGPIDQATPANKDDSEPKIQYCPGCSEAISLYAFSCPCCELKLRDKPIKVCDHCGAGCPPATTTCPMCGSLFLSHTGKSDSGILISTDDDAREHKVTRITAYPSRATKSGRRFLVVQFWTVDGATYKKNVFIGWSGNAGMRARDFWMWLTCGKFIEPDSPARAASMINEHFSMIRPITSIKVDHRSKYCDIMRIDQKQVNDKQIGAGS